MSSQRARSMTVIIHGTFSQGDLWFRPNAPFHRYLRKHGFADAYTGSDFFAWSGAASDSARRTAARDLLLWCAKHPAGQLRIIGHSHGANVANIATQLGLRVCTLIHLSPPVLPEYLPDINNIQSGQFFTVHPTYDAIVAGVPRARQDYQSYPDLATHETLVYSGPSGHWSPTKIEKWERYDVADAVTTVCLPRAARKQS